MTDADHAQLQDTLTEFTVLAERRRTRGLSVDGLITHQKLAARLRELTDQAETDQACERARQLLAEAGHVEVRPVVPGPPVSAPSARTSAAPARATAQTDSSLCSECSKPLGKRGRDGVHRGCRPVACADCGGVFPQRSLLIGRSLCLLCAAKAQGQVIPSQGVTPVTAAQLEAILRTSTSTNRAAARQAAAQRTPAASAASTPRKRTPMELANLERQERQRREARRLAKLKAAPEARTPPAAVVFRAGLPGSGRR